jgi:tetratricopeptide (TPR) repeat protein
MTLLSTGGVLGRMPVAVPLLALGLTFTIPFAIGQTSKKVQPPKSRTLKAAPTPVPKRSGAVAAKPKPKPKPKATPDPAAENSKFESALAATGEEKIKALQAFLVEYPAGASSAKAREALTVALAEAGDLRLQADDAEGGISFFRQAVEGLPSPIPDRLFDEVVSKFPANLFYRGHGVAAVEVAGQIEKKAGGNAKQLLSLAGFHLGIENGSEAKRLAARAVEISPTSAGHQALGLANRLNFDLEAAAASYVKALEIEPGSLAAKRSLAELYRALGRGADSITLYREILAQNETDGPARTGLVLALLSAAPRAEAEAELLKLLQADPKNLRLLAGAAYWYAAHGDNERAIELADEAIAVEPRFVWSYIAKARALVAMRRPVEAERVLMVGRQYGNFPTMNYEIASARYAAGFFRDAAEELQNVFEYKEDELRTKLGGRIDRTAPSFAQLVAAERQASIFEPLGGEDAATGEKLKSLLSFAQAINGGDADAAAAAADSFAAGSDPLRIHRELYAADSLLQKRLAAKKALELSRAAVGGADGGLDVADPTSAVMASELYQSRAIAFARNEFVAAPPLPRQTLSAILRGRIEHLIGSSLLEQGDPAEAGVRLRRAVSVLPEKSAWWRSAMWNLGSALEAEGRSAEALDAYVKSYTSGVPDVVRYVVVENLYKKVNGGIEGLEAKIGRNPLQPAAAETPQAAPDPAPSPVPGEIAVPVALPAADPVAAAAEPKPEELKPEDPSARVPAPSADAQPSPQPAAEAPALPTPTTSPEPTPLASPVPTPEPSPQPAALPEPTPEPSPEASIVPARAEPIATPEPKPSDAAEKASDDEKAAKEPIAAPKKPSDAAEKGLFEPVVITIPPPPKPRVGREQGIAHAKPNGAPAEPADRKDDKPADPGIDPADSASAGQERPRYVKKPDDPVPPPCTVVVSEESVSLINDGGRVGILVGFDGEGDPAAIKAIPSSTADLDVSLVPEVAGISGRVFFIIRSVSKNVGLYEVAFEAPCGKRSVTVKVR